jgi:succinate-acetate transporter protein
VSNIQPTKNPVLWFLDGWVLLTFFVFCVVIFGWLSVAHFFVFCVVIFGWLSVARLFGRLKR